MLERNEMLNEAIDRMKMLKIMAQPIKELKEGKLNLSEGFGALYWLNEEEQEAVSEFEKENEALVYHVIKSFFKMSEKEVLPMYSYLYVSKYKEEWEMDREDLKEGRALAYVKNMAWPECSEFGSIGVKPSMGGVVRTW